VSYGFTGRRTGTGPGRGSLERTDLRVGYGMGYPYLAVYGFHGCLVVGCEGSLAFLVVGREGSLAFQAVLAEFHLGFTQLNQVSGRTF
jgi:hypothetical protein